MNSIASSSSANITQLLSTSLDELVKKKAAAQKYRIRNSYNSSRGNVRGFANNGRKGRRRNIAHYQSANHSREQRAATFSKTQNYNFVGAKNSQKFGTAVYRNTEKYHFRSFGRRGAGRWKSRGMRPNYIPKSKDKNSSSFSHSNQALNLDRLSDNINNHAANSMNSKYRGDGLLLTPQKQTRNLRSNRSFRSSLAGKYVAKKPSGFVNNKNFNVFPSNSFPYNNKNVKKLRGTTTDYSGNRLNTSLYRIRDKNAFLVRSNNMRGNNYIHRKGNKTATSGNSKFLVSNGDEDDDNKLHLNMKDRQLMKKIKIVCELSSVPSPSNAQKVACSANNNEMKFSSEYENFYNNGNTNTSGIFNNNHANNNNNNNEVHNQLKTKTLDERFSSRA